MRQDMKQKKLRNKMVWITGASAGIGREMALWASEAGARLCLISSRLEVLQETARQCRERGAVSVHVKAIDLSSGEEAFRKLAALAAECDAPDYLILNAGVSQRSRVLDTEPATARKIMDLNFFGSAAVVNAVLPAMIAAGGGCIGVTSSLTGVFGFPLRSSYSASKHALHGYFESLALEYADSGISVTLAIPGFIRTDVSA
ncbi:MAG: short-chain dehydrogenase [Spirochaetales bacterium]|nr:MAG: short-chain dehydrogenase [Spirochaetales bacterium]